MSLKQNVSEAIKRGTPAPTATKEIFQPSRKTQKLLDDLAAMRIEELDTAPAIEALLGDDKEDVGTLAQKIGSLRAQADILRARRLRRRDECVSMVRSDLALACSAAEKTRIEAASAASKAEAEFRETVRREHPAHAAEQLVGDANLRPHSHRLAKAAEEECRDREAAVCLLASAIDIEHQRRKQIDGQRWAGQAEPAEKIVARNLAVFWPCLAG
jgi:hypothetical protein